MSNLIKSWATFWWPNLQQLLNGQIFSIFVMAITSRNVLGTKDLGAILSERESIAHDMQVPPPLLVLLLRILRHLLCPLILVLLGFFSCFPCTFIPLPIPPGTYFPCLVLLFLFLLFLLLLLLLLPLLLVLLLSFPAPPTLAFTSVQCSASAHLPWSPTVLYTPSPTTAPSYLLLLLFFPLVFQQ